MKLKPIELCKDILQGKQECRDLLISSLEDDDFIDAVNKLKLVTLISGYYKIDETWCCYQQFEPVISRVKRMYSAGEEFFKRHPEIKSYTVKGFVSSQLYPERWWRQVGDLDIYMPLNQASVFHSQMINDGFLEVSGYMERRVPTPNNRRMAMMYLIQNSHELPKLKNGNGLYIDTNFRALYRGNEVYREMFSIDAVENYFSTHWKNHVASSTSFPSWEMTFLFIVLHHSAEIILFNMQNKSDVSTDIALGKLFDILLIAKRGVFSVAQIRDMLEKSSGYALFNHLFWLIDDLFNDKDWRNLGEAVNVTNSVHENIFFSAKAKKRRWMITPSERILPVNVMNCSESVEG